MKQTEVFWKPSLIEHEIYNCQSFFGRSFLNAKLIAEPPKMLNNLKNVAVVSLSTGGSRVLGLLRDVLLFAALGASVWNSAFLLAFMLPNLFRRLLGEGAMTSAMVPVFSEVLERDGRAAAFQFFSRVFFRLLGGLLVLSFFGMLTLGLIVKTGFLPERWQLGAELSVYLLPYMVFICLSAIVAAGLNVIGRFAAPASTPMLLNLSIIGSLLLGMVFGKDASEIVYWLCGGVLFGGLLQLFVPAVDLARQGWRPRPVSGQSEELGELMRLFFPALAGAAILQVNIMVSRFLAHSLNESAVSVLYLASRLMELPLGLFTVAVSTVFFPLMAQAINTNDEASFAESFTSSMRLVIAISIPAGVGLFVLGGPIVELLRFGRFDSADGLMTASLVAIYGIGLPFYSAATILTRGLHAGKVMRVTVSIAGVSLIVNLCGSLILMQFWAERGLAIANVLAAVVQSILLWRSLSRHRKELRLFDLVPAFAKISGAAIPMGLICWGGLIATRATELGGKIHAILAVGLLVPVGILSYFAILNWMRFEELHYLTQRLKRLVQRGAGQA